jgi:hypothetical protein
MKALEVLINGKLIGLYVPPEGECFGVMLGNVPRTYMRAQVTSDNQTGLIVVGACVAGPVGGLMGAFAGIGAQ